MTELKNGDRAISSGMPSAYKGRIDIEGRASLLITNVTFQDSTTFRCTLRAEPTAGLQDQVSIVRVVVTGMV